MFVDEIFRRVMKLIWWRSKFSIEEKMLIWPWAQNYHWRNERKRRRKRRRKRKKKRRSVDADLIIDSKLSNWRKMWSWFDEAQSFRLKKRCWFDHWLKVIELTKNVKLIWWNSEFSFEEKMLIWSLIQSYRIDDEMLIWSLSSELSNCRRKKRRKWKWQLINRT